MAHNLEEKNGKTSFVNAGYDATAWHGKGTHLKNAITAEEAIREGGLDFEVIKTPVLYGVDDQTMEFTNKFCTVRSDTNKGLGIVSSTYEIIQNRDLFTFFDQIVEKDEAVYHTAGVLGNGEKVFVSAKMGNHIRIAGTDDVTEVYISMVGGHDGMTGVTAMVTPVRIVCANTLAMALRGTKNKVSIPHMKNASDRLIAAVDILGISNQYSVEMEQIFNIMAKTQNHC